MKKIFFRAILLVLAITFVSCEHDSTPNFTPNEYTFSEAHEMEGIMVYVSDKAFHGKVVTPGISPGFKTFDDTTYFVYKHFDEVFPCTLCGEKVYYLDTVRILARTTESKDYNNSIYYCADIVEILEVKSARAK